MLVKVTQIDIDNGVPCDGCLCPIALAIDRDYNLDVKVHADGGIVINDGEKETEVWAGYEAASFIESFDDGNEVNPFSFELDYNN